MAPSAEQMLLIVFTGNLIGVACARSLHFQFYSWCAWRRTPVPVGAVTLKPNCIVDAAYLPIKHNEAQIDRHSYTLCKA